MKYVIDIPDEMIQHAFQVRVENPMNTYGKCYYTTVKPEPYIESGREAIEKEVWDFAGEIIDLDYRDHNKCFGIEDVIEESVFSKYTYNEAKEAYEAWKAEKSEIDEEEDIQVGDVVTVYGEKAIVLYIYDREEKREYDVLFGDGSSTRIDVLHVTKTGRYFPEIIELLNKIGDES